MHKIMISVALFVTLGALAVSCQKESVIEDVNLTMEHSTIYTVSYSIDGVMHTVSLIGEDAWHEFLHWMIALAEEGYEVSFRNEEAASRVVATKDVVTYTTNDHDDAYTWANKMANLGYWVTISYDERTGKYTCIAVK